MNNAAEKTDSLPVNRPGWSRRKKMLWGGVLLAGLLLAGAAVWYWWPRHAPDPRKLTDDQAIHYMASKAFADLTEKEKLTFMERMKGRHPHPGQVKLSAAEQRNMQQNMQKVIYKMIQTQLRRFFAQSQAEQDAELDKFIAMMPKPGQRPGGPGGRPGGPGGPGGKPPAGAPSPGAMVKAMLEDTDSSTRAQGVEFLKRVSQRMQQKGMAVPNPLND